MYTTDYVIDSSPAIGLNGTIYLGCFEGNLYAFNSNGTLNWHVQNWDSNSLTDGLYTSPAIGSTGIIYVGCDDGNLYAYNSNGTLEWRYHIGYIVSSPSIGSNGIIYVGSYNDNLYAINPNGTLKWKYTTGSFVESSPVIGSDGTIYVGSWNQVLYALSPNGLLKWKYTAGDSITSSPVIGLDGTLYFGCYNNKLYAIMNPLIVTANHPGGYYNNTQNIILSINKTGTIYYTTNGSTPTINSTKYNAPIKITSNMNLKYLAVDSYGNKSPVYTQTYIIDKIPPTISSTSPNNNASHVSLTSPITIKFTENIKIGTNYSNI